MIRNAHDPSRSGAELGRGNYGKTRSSQGDEDKQVNLAQYTDMAVAPYAALSPGKLTTAQHEAMHKLLESDAFASAPRLRAVLAYLLQKVEDGESEQITEQSIGQAVFGKPPGYNASEDNIVRVTIRHLRTRLEQYYRTEGKDDAFSLVIPKGKYIPSLMPREPEILLPPPSPERIHYDASAAGSPSSALGLGQSEVVTPSIIPLARPGRRNVWLLGGAAILLAFCAGFAVRSAVTPALKSTSGLLGLLCPPSSNLSIVVVDSNLQAYRQIFEKQVSLNDYIHREYAKTPTDSLDVRLANAQRFSTGTNETNVSSAIIAAAFRNALTDRRIAIKHPHDVSIREFQEQEDVVLLGGPWINPWGQLFEARLNFRLVPLPGEPASSKVHNNIPQPGEAPEYVPHMDGNLNVNYARVAILPNFQKTGRVILIGATSPEALEAAGDYLLSGEAIREILSNFHAHSANALPPVEFLIEVRGLNAVPGSRQIVAERLVHW